MDPIERRRRERNDAFHRRVIVGSGVALLAVVLAGVAVGLLVKRGAHDPGSFHNQAFGPRADREGVEWSHAELMAHLAARDKTWKWEPVVSGPFGSSIHIYAAAPGEKDRVFCLKLASAQAAKDMAGAKPSGAFAWGRFVFDCPDATRLDRIRAALD